MNVDIPDEGFDLVIMNPPFTSNTKHFDADQGVLNAAFAAFDSSDKEQADMAERLKLLGAGTNYHGHAGLGSAFASLANKKVKPGGIIGLVLPFTLLNGASWAKVRELVAVHYEEVTIVSIAANGWDMSFSSDTGMAECLIVARKKGRNKSAQQRAVFGSLTSRPNGFIGAFEIAKAMNQVHTTRTIEGGPFGGNPMFVGETLVGELLDSPLKEHSKGWGAARLLDTSVAQVAYSISQGELWLPAQVSPLSFPVANLADVGRRGLDSQLFISAAHKGPFAKEAASPTATYPALWNHDAKKEKRMVCYPDSALRVRPDFEERSAKIWATASRSHLTREFTFGSQALAVAFTEQRTLGGTVWPNVAFDEESYDFAFNIWSNSTLGLVSYWWHSSRQQSSKARMTIRSSESLPILDFRTLTDAQLTKAEKIFKEFHDKDLMPAYLADADPNRALLDRRVVCDLLGFDESVYQGVRRLAEKWCAEPSVRGGKPRPTGTKFVM